MMKVFRRILLSILILVALVVFIFVAFQLVSSFTLKSMLLYDSASSAKAWLDENGNGYWDSSEPPLQGVCVWSEMSPSAYNEFESRCQFSNSRTDDKGIWHGDFFAGAKSDDIYIFTNAPSGYHSTTPPAVHSSYAEFGFAPESVLSRNEIRTRYEYVKEAIQNEEFALRLKSILGQVIFWGSIVLLVSLSIFLSIKIDRALIHAGFA